jgi:hypothetical protein
LEEFVQCIHSRWCLHAHSTCTAKMIDQMLSCKCMYESMTHSWVLFTMGSNWHMLCFAGVLLKNK